MSADEMFKELGYEKNERDCFLTYKKYIKEKHQGYVITFYLMHKEIEAEISDDDAYDYFTKRLKPEEIRAINKKCEELGW